MISYNPDVKQSKQYKFTKILLSSRPECYYSRYLDSGIVYASLNNKENKIPELKRLLQKQRQFSTIFSASLSIEPGWIFNIEKRNTNLSIFHWQ